MEQTKKRNILKIILLTTILLILNNIKIFSYSISDFDDITGNAATFYIMNNFYYDNAFSIATKSVVMTQDNDKYYFDIKAELDMKDCLKDKIIYKEYNKSNGGENSLWMSKSLCEWNMTPIVYSKENFTKDQINWYYGIDFRGGSEDKDYLNYVYFGTKRVNYFHWMRYYLNRKLSYIYDNDWSEKFFMLYPFLGMNPFPLKNCYNPKTGAYDVDCTGPSVMVKNSEGFSYIANNCSIKEYELSPSNYYSKVIYNVESKIAIEKSYINDYRYFAYGGMTFLTHLENHNGFFDYQGVFSTSDTIDLGEYAFCEHEWQYSYVPHLLKHNKKCKKCNWEIEEEHYFINEYDGIKNNLCACGYNKKVNLEFEINDDYNSYEKKEVETYGKREVIEYKNKTGYNFLYYEKTSKEIVGNLSTRSTILKISPVERISTISDAVENQSIKYKAIYEPLRFTISYNTTRGIFNNGKNNIQKNYVYQDVFKFEDMHDLPQDESYFLYWVYNGQPIKTINDIKKYIITQDMHIDLFAYFDRPSIGKNERTKDGKNPRAEGGFDEENKKILDDEKQQETNDEKKGQNESENKYKKEKKVNNDIIGKSEIEVYNMTSTEISKLGKLLGIKKASISEIDNKIVHNIFGNEIIFNLIVFIIVNKWMFLLLVLIILLLIVKKTIKKNRKNK